MTAQNFIDTAQNAVLLAADKTEHVTYGNPILNISIFVGFVVITMVIVFRVGRTTKDASDYYSGGRGFSGRQNGIAISGDYLSAASFLGVTGAIAITGYDGFLYSIGFLVAFLIAMLLVAELLRNTGRFTMADVLSFRLKERPVRTAAAISTLTVSFFYLLAQMAGAGGLVALLLGINDPTGIAIVITVVGILMIVYVLVGGMKGTTWVQIIKGFLLVSASIIMALWVLIKYGFNFSALLGDAVTRRLEDSVAAGKPLDPTQAAQLLEPGLKYGIDAISRLDFISLAIALVLGTAGLPHVLMRFYTVPTSKEARKSVVWTIWLVGIFYICALVLGFGAAAIVGPNAINGAPGKQNSAAPLLAFFLGGDNAFGAVALGIVAAIAFATILAVVAGLAITASASFAHDLYSNVFKKSGTVSSEEEVKVARITVVVIGVVAIAGGILAQGQNVAALVALAFAIAASANLPTILYSLFWKGFTTQGALWSMYSGLILSIGLIVFSPVVSGSETSMIPGADFAWFPLANPGLISIPVAFFLGWLGSVLQKDKEDPIKQAEMEVRSLTGAGAEKASSH